MGCVVTIESPHKSFLKKLTHYLFHCPSFWSIKPRYHCSKCGAGFRCYWDANDIEGHGIDICNRCAKKIEEARQNIKDLSDGGGRGNEQEMGGKLEIPDGYFVYKVDLDHAEPYCTIMEFMENKEIKLPIPKSLAYYLRTHFCGSESYHKSVQEDAVRALQNEMKKLLGFY